MQDSQSAIKAALSSLALLLVLPQLGLQAQSPWDKAAQRKEPQHSVITLWPGANGALYGSNPNLRWHAARLAHRYPDFYDTEDLQRALRRERRAFVRAALRRTLSLREANTVDFRSSTNSNKHCKHLPPLWHAVSNNANDADEVVHGANKIAHGLLPWLKLAAQIRGDAPHSDEKLERLMAAPLDEEPKLVLRAIAGDRSAHALMLRWLDSQESEKQHAAILALTHLDVAASKSKRTADQKIEEAARTLLSRISTTSTLHIAMLQLLRARTSKLSHATFHAIGESKRAWLQKSDPLKPLTSAESYFLKDFAAFEALRLLLERTPTGKAANANLQRELRTWLEHTDASWHAMAIFVSARQSPSLPLFTLLPFIDSSDARVRLATGYALADAIGKRPELSKWLEADMADSKLRNILANPSLKQEPTPNGPAVWISDAPLHVSWEGGQELLFPGPGGLIFLPRVPSLHVACHLY